jgi:hypothetical protein
MYEMGVSGFCDDRWKERGGRNHLNIEHSRTETGKALT